MKSYQSQLKSQLNSLKKRINDKENQLEQYRAHNSIDDKYIEGYRELNSLRQDLQIVQSRIQNLGREGVIIPNYTISNQAK